MAIPKTLCMSCFTVLYDDHSKKMPKKGDALVCLYCGFIMEFDENLKGVEHKNPNKELLEISALVKLIDKFVNIDSNISNIKVKNEAKKKR